MFAPILSLALAAGNPADGNLQAAQAASQSVTDRYMAAYALCAVRDNHDRVFQSILSDLDDESLEFRYNDVFVKNPVRWASNCRELHIAATEQVYFKGDPLRHALALRLMQVDMAADHTTSFADKAPLSHRAPPSHEVLEKQLAATDNANRRARLQQAYDEAFSLAWLPHFGECVARRDPQATHAWVLATPGSLAESDVLTALNASLGACLVEGRQLHFSKSILRGTLAVSYYRLAMAAPQSTPPSTPPSSSVH